MQLILSGFYLGHVHSQWLCSHRRRVHTAARQKSFSSQAGIMAATQFEDRLHALSTAFESTLSLDAEDEECAAMLRQAHQLLAQCRSRYTTVRGARAKQLAGAPPPPPPSLGGDDGDGCFGDGEDDASFEDGSTLSGVGAPVRAPAVGAPPRPQAHPPPPAPPPPPPQVDPDLSPEEREEREMAARRAQFVLGACADDEVIDWSAPACTSDDEGDSTGAGVVENDAAAAAAAARVLDAVHGDLSDAPAEGEPAAPESTWESLPGYVPQGSVGFNAFARERMRRAGVPANSKVEGR